MNVFSIFNNKLTIKEENIIDHLISGSFIIVEGGYYTGKSDLLKRTKESLLDMGYHVICLNASNYFNEWLRDYSLLGKTLDKKISYFLASLPDNFILLVDNADKIQDSRKMDFILTLINKSSSVLLSCIKSSFLNPRIRSRLTNHYFIHLGSGGSQTDFTYFLIAALIILVALTGHINIVFMAAAFRYLFQGARASSLAK